jgi:hypothetical protein
MTPLPVLARQAGLPPLHLIEDDRVFVRKVYMLARRMQDDPATTPRRKLALDAYAVSALGILASEPDRAARA